MLQISCQGSPHEIGIKHGSAAKAQIQSCIAFYADVFQKTAKMDWKTVTTHARRFEDNIAQKWPEYLEEMKGVAHGSNTDVLDIVALNVRTEIMFGCHHPVSDGCTAFSWYNSNDTRSFLGQNWDWMEAQKANLILLTIDQPGKPTIKMVTEAGIIGKIGQNSAGVGVCLNAIRVSGVDATRIPCHLGLRLVLDSSSREEAVSRLMDCGVASQCHMLVADETGGIGLEWSAKDVAVLDMNERGQVFHSNHYIKEHPGLDVKPWLADSDFRLDRIEKLCNSVSGSPSTEGLLKVLEDEKNFPASICRSAEDVAGIATLFSIVMDLRDRKGVVRLGRPSEPEAAFRWSF